MVTGEQRRKVLSSMFDDFQYEDIMRQYNVDYKKVKIYGDDKDLSENFSKAKNLIAKVFNLDWWQVGGLRKKIILMTSDLYSENSEIIKSFLKSIGFFTSVHIKELYNIHGKTDTRWSIMQFEPLHQKDYTKRVVDKGVAWHLTPAYNVLSILKNGIIPHNNNGIFDYPDRSYFFSFKKINHKRITEVGNLLYLNNDDERNNGIYCLLKIDLKNLPDNIKFYKDYNCNNGVFTEDKIPADIISSVKYYDFKTIKQNQKDK